MVADTILTLPDELLSLVLCQLDSASPLGRLCSTCRRINRAARGSILWATLLRKHLAASPSPVRLPENYFVSTPDAWLLGSAERPPALRSGLSWRGVLREVLASEVAARLWKLRKTLLFLDNLECCTALEVSELQRKAAGLNETLRRRGSAAQELRTELGGVWKQVHALQPRLRDVQAEGARVRRDLDLEEAAAAKLKGARIHHLLPPKPTARTSR